MPCPSRRPGPRSPGEGQGGVYCQTPPVGGRAQGHPRGVSGQWVAIYCPTPPPGGRSPGPPLEGPTGKVGCHPLPDTSSISPGAGRACAQRTVAEWRTADGLVASDRGTWGPNSTVQGWAEGAPAWTRCGAGRNRREGPAGPSWGFDFPSTPTNGAHVSLPWDAGRTALTHADPWGPAELRRPPSCREHRPAAVLPEGLGRCLPSHPHSQHVGPFSGDPAPCTPSPCTPGHFSGDPTPRAPPPRLQDPSRETPPCVPPGPGLRDPSRETLPRLPPDPGLQDSSQETLPCLPPGLGLRGPSRETPPHVPPGPGLRDPSQETLPRVPPGLGLRIPLVPQPCPPRKPACSGQQAAWYKPFLQVLKGIPFPRITKTCGPNPGAGWQETEPAHNDAITGHACQPHACLPSW